MEELDILRNNQKILQQQNADLALSLQHYKTECSRLLSENLSLEQQNTKYKHQMIKLQKLENLKYNLTRNLNDIINSTNNIRKIQDILDEKQTDIWNKQSPLAARSLFQSNAPNINHVHPMIQGVTMKKPIIRISRTDLNVIPVNNAEDETPIEEQPLNEDLSSNIEADEEEFPIVSQNTDSPSRLLDLSVSLRRVDSVSPSQNVNTGIYTEPGSSQSNVLENSSKSQETDMSNQNSSFTEESEGSANIISGEPYEYPSRLECIIEESETENTNWVSSRKKLNPFVVINNTLECDSDKMSTISKSFISNTNTINDDPMEGTSWRFNEDNVDVRPRSKSSSKNLVHTNIDSRQDSLESSQVPDSTTSIALFRDSQEREQSFTKSFPSVIEFQSTPVSINQSEHKENESPFINKYGARDNSGHYPIEVKVILSKMSADPCSPKKSKSVKSKIKNTRKKSPVSDTIPKRRKKNSCAESNDSQNSLSLQSTNSIEVETCRPRRGDAKNYKEKPLNKKLRRSK